MAETSSAPKPVVVRVKRKPSQSPLDAFWLEINERPLKRPLLDFGNLSISNSAQKGFEIGLKCPLSDFENLSVSESAQKVEFHTKKVFVQHLETISRSEATLDIVRKNVKNNNKQGRLSIKDKARQEKECLAKNARFEQIWKSRKGVEESALQEMCHFYEIARIDNNEEKAREVVPEEDISLEDQRLLSSYLPLLREVIPNAAAEIESDMLAHSQQEDYVYDLYTVNDVMVPVEDPSNSSYPLVQVDNEDYFYDGPDDSDYETDDSNAEDNPQNDYPDEISEEEGEGSECESEEESDRSSASDESSNEDDLENGADPLYDEELDDYEGLGKYDGEDGDEYVDDDDEDWMMS